VDEVDGDNMLWCVECQRLIQPADGVHNLSEDWQAL
jgi:hypothetical protein